MIDISPERFFKILEMRKFPENAKPEDVKSLADDFILMLYTKNIHRDIAVGSIIKTEEEHGKTGTG